MSPYAILAGSHLGLNMRTYQVLIIICYAILSGSYLQCNMPLYQLVICAPIYRSICISLVAQSIALSSYLLLPNLSLFRFVICGITCCSTRSLFRVLKCLPSEFICWLASKVWVYDYQSYNRRITQQERLEIETRKKTQMKPMFILAISVQHLARSAISHNSTYN